MWWLGMLGLLHEDSLNQCMERGDALLTAHSWGEHCFAGLIYELLLENRVAISDPGNADCVDRGAATLGLRPVKLQ